MVEKIERGESRYGSTGSGINNANLSVEVGAKEGGDMKVSIDMDDDE